MRCRRTLTTKPQAPRSHDKGEATAEPAVDVAKEPDSSEPIDMNRKAIVESILLMGNKGWRDERKLRAFHDYLMSRQTHRDFNNSIRKMR